MSAAAGGARIPEESDWCLCGCGAAVVQDPAYGRGAARRFFADAVCVLRYRATKYGERYPTLVAIERERAARAAARAVRPKPTPPPPRVKTAEELEHLTLRWGPLRAIAQELARKGETKRVALVCGHEASIKIGATGARCRPCRRAGGA